MENAKDSSICTPTGIQLHKKLLHNQDSTKVKKYITYIITRAGLHCVNVCVLGNIDQLIKRIYEQRKIMCTYIQAMV